jgi:hypothetical protein
MWVWICIGALAIMNMFTAGALLWMRKEQKEMQPNTDDSEYVEVIKHQHEEYITQIREEMNHTHGIPLTHEDIVESPLFHYTTQAMVNGLPVEKAAKTIVHRLDTLLKQKQKQEETDPRVEEIRKEAATARQLRTGQGD